MSNRIKRSAVLLKASWEVLKSHRSLLLLPIISSIVTLVVIASFTVPVVTALSLDPELRSEVSAEMKADLASQDQSSTASTPATTADPAKTASVTRTPKDADAAEGGGLSDFWKATGILYLLFFYISTSFVVIFFNAALIAAADEHFQGRPTGLRIGLGLALRRVPLILAWSIVAGTSFSRGSGSLHEIAGKAHNSQRCQREPAPAGPAAGAAPAVRCRWPA